MNAKDYLIQGVEKLRVSTRRLPLYVPIDTRDNRILIISDKSDESTVSVDEFDNGEIVEEPSRLVCHVLIEDLDDENALNNIIDFANNKAIHMIHCNDLVVDFDKIRPIAEKCDLVIAVVNNRGLLLRDANGLRNREVIENPVGL